MFLKRWISRFWNKLTKKRKKAAPLKEEEEIKFPPPEEYKDTKVRRKVEETLLEIGRREMTKIGDNLKETHEFLITTQMLMAWGSMEDIIGKINNILQLYLNNPDYGYTRWFDIPQIEGEMANLSLIQSLDVSIYNDMNELELFSEKFLEQISNQEFEEIVIELNELNERVDKLSSSLEQRRMLIARY